MSRIACDFYRHGLRTAFCLHVACCLVVARLNQLLASFFRMANIAFFRPDACDCWQESFTGMAASAFLTRDCCQLIDRR